MKLEKKNLIFSFLCVLIPFYVNAEEISSGKIYRIRNVGKPENCLSVSTSAPGAVGAISDEADLKQQWYLESDMKGEGFYFRNVSNGAYLSSPKELYTQWPLMFQNVPSDDIMLMSVEEYDGNKTIRALSHKNGYAYAHNDASNTIVCWTASSSPTQWTFEEVPYSDEEIKEILVRFSETGDEIAKAPVYQQHLDNLFSDSACTDLIYSGDLETNEDYKALPPALQNMVKKIRINDWTEEAGDWDNVHAKKYRVQLYEPYSEGSSAAALAGIQAYTNMNNPTGIIGNEGDILYVMVDKDVEEGASLYIGGVPDCNMYNNPTSGTRLQKGLNMILCNADNTHYFIYYTVTTASGKQRIRKVTDFDPITIHIEGGEINGFFNYVGDSLYTPDTEVDYRYTIERAKHPMYDLMGKYVILHFFKDDTPDTQTSTQLQMGVKSALDPEMNPGPTKHYDPVVIMKAWDDMCFAERMLMGLQPDQDITDDFNQGMYSSIINDNLTHGKYSISLSDPYSDYFNNRMMGITLQAAGLYMNATSWRTAYAPSTISAILSQFPQDGIWGPAHEYGHINQTPMRIAGTTEESNNVFSNVANYYLCRTTSRCSYPSNQLEIFNQGKTYLENGTWGTTRMFWQLWCYYHATKHNTKFYPRLYELLRNYPLVRDLTTIPGKLNPKTDLLHFAKMCCVAAEEDLTNFFTSWGFFVPQDNYHIDDYDVYDCVLTQEDIDEVKNEIKDFNFPINDAIILIDDRPGSDLPAGFGYSKELCGEYGGLKDFEFPQNVSGEFTFTIDGNKVTVSGDGNPGVGFLVYDNNGELLGFSNSDTFTLNSEAVEAIMNGQATIKAIDAFNNSLEVKDADPELTAARVALKRLISEAEEVLALSGEIWRMDPQEIIFTEENYYTNAPYQGNNYDKFTSWSVIYDNDPATYFHSNYNNNIDSEDGLDHYIRMEAPENSTFRFFDLSYTTRQVENTGTNPRAISIEASSDKSEWSTIFRSANLPTGSAVEYTTGEIAAPAGTRFIRMMVTEGPSSAHGHPYFCVSELHVSDLGDPVFEPSAIYPELTSEVMKKLFDEMVNAGILLRDSLTGLESLQEQAESLSTEIANVQALMTPEENDSPETPDTPGAPDNPDNPDNPDQPDDPNENPGSVTGLESSEAPVRIYDIHGRLIKSSLDTEDIPNLKPGIYIIQQGGHSREIMVK